MDFERYSLEDIEFYIFEIQDQLVEIVVDWIDWLYELKTSSMNEEIASLKEDYDEKVKMLNEELWSREHFDPENDWEVIDYQPFEERIAEIEETMVKIYNDLKAESFPWIKAELARRTKSLLYILNLNQTFNLTDFNLEIEEGVFNDLVDRHFGKSPNQKIIT